MTLCFAQVTGLVAWTPVMVTVADHWSVSLAAGGFLKESLVGEGSVQLRTLMAGIYECSRLFVMAECPY